MELRQRLTQRDERISELKEELESKCRFSEDLRRRLSSVGAGPSGRKGARALPGQAVDDMRGGRSKSLCCQQAGSASGDGAGEPHLVHVAESVFLLVEAASRCVHTQQVLHAMHVTCKLL